jgi:ComF family protein
MWRSLFYQIFMGISSRIAMLYVHMMKKVARSINFILSWIFPEPRDIADFHAMSLEEVYGAIPRAQHSEAKKGLIDPDIRAVWQYDTPFTKILIRGLKERRDMHATRCAAFGIYKVLQEEYFAKQAMLAQQSGLMANSASGKNRTTDREIDTMSTQLKNRMVDRGTAHVATTKIILVPIPLSRKRLRERGYNQCELIVQEIVKLYDTNMTAIEVKKNVLKRSHSRTEQKTKGRADRISESKNFFSIAPDADIADTMCIVIDDVVTTGSTLVAAKHRLLASGAREVIMIAVAH